MNVMKVWKFMYVAAGVFLAAGSVVTAEHGLSEMNRDIYQNALALDEEMEKLGFGDFSLRDRKVRFYDGNYDYVVQTDAAEQITVNKEKAQLDVFAGTTLEVDGEWQVLLPTYEQFSGLFDALGTLDSYQQGMRDGSFAFSESGYGTDMHTATIWHEAFHAWQAENWQESMDVLMDQAGDENPEDIIVREVDTSQALTSLFNEEMRLLMKAYDAKDLTEKKMWTAKALETAGERAEKLSDGARAMEYYLENYEGSARYVESMAYRELAGDAAWRDVYLKEFQYENGSGKYYHMGMLKCVLLDQLTDGWQQDFSDEMGIDELLYGGVYGGEKICDPGSR